MFEVIILMLGSIVMSYITVTWLKVLVLAILLILILPGVYAMYFGAPLVPSKREAIEKMVRLSRAGKGDSVVDLGCGDGRLIRAFAKVGVRRAIGYEFSIPTYLLAKLRSFFGSGEKIHFANFWKEDFSKFDVIACFLLVDRMADFKKIIWPQLKSGVRIVTNCGKIPGIEPVIKEGTVYFYQKT